jgi:hypothetical protein
MKGNKMDFLIHRNYEVVTDYPAPFPKILVNPIEIEREEPLLSPLFQAEMKPLLVGSDLGLNISELFVRIQEYS